MKSNKTIILTVILSLLFFGNCEQRLKEEVFSQIDPLEVFTSPDGIESILYGAYGYSQIIGNLGNNISFFEDWSTDQSWETGGGANRNAVLMINFTWDASNPTHFSALWNNLYKSIRNCNLVLDGIDGAPIEEVERNRLKAEARFIRAASYYTLYSLHGPVPLRTSSEGELSLARASEEEMRLFLETEFTAAANDLPKKGELANYEYGRATKGAALGYLTKFFLNTKQWQKCNEVASELIELNIYQLWPDYKSLFQVENEEVNHEYIYVASCLSTGPGNEYMNGAFPPGYSRRTDGSAVFTTSMRNWARQDRLYDSFYNSFDPNDKRLEVIVSEYINNKGKIISLLNNDNTRAFKFHPDPDAIGNEHGNDIPIIRYADILLAQAEALNELNGPSQQALDLIDMVRLRAGLTPLNIADFPSKESLRDHILDERGWEFFTERKRRQDLIRHGKYISSAQNRGAVNAKPYHTLFPIPQNEIDANSKITQNDGY